MYYAKLSLEKIWNVPRDKCEPIMVYLFNILKTNVLYVWLRSNL